MKIEQTEIPGVLVIEPDVHRDRRGYFAETYNERRYRELGLEARFVQDNESFSHRGVVRGLHWQAAPRTQAKLVRVIRGAVWDVAVDIRRGSPTFGKSVSRVLTAQNAVQFFIPKGFAHGFVVLEDETLFAYKCDDFYDPPSERGLNIRDPELEIALPEIGGGAYLFSEKDLRHPNLCDITPWSAV